MNKKNITVRLGGTSNKDWYALDFGQPHEISSIRIYLVEDGKTFDLPGNISTEYKNNNTWIPVKLKESNHQKLIGNTVNEFDFDKINVEAIRVNFTHKKKQVAVTEIECY
jgi:hypothetical protein